MAPSMHLPTGFGPGQHEPAVRRRSLWSKRQRGREALFAVGLLAVQSGVAFEGARVAFTERSPYVKGPDIVA